MPTRLAQVRAERGWKKARLVRELGVAAARRNEVLPKDDSLGRRIAVWENQGGAVSDFYRDLLCEVYGLSAVDLGLVQPPTVSPPPMPLLDPAESVVSVWHQAAAGATGELADDEEVTLLCRLRDGRLTVVTIPRRTILSGGIGLGALTAIGFGSPAAAGTASPERLVRAAAAYGATPVEHLSKLRRVLIDSDNMLGPRQALATVHEQVKVIHALRRDSRGSDRRELMQLQTQFAEFASWLHQDVGDHRAAETWLNRALQWSHTASDRKLTCYVMARKSQLATDAGDGLDAVDLAHASRGLAAPDSRLVAIASTYEGVGHALTGDRSASEHAFDHAQVVADSAAADPSPWGAWLDGSYVQVHRAYGLEALGRYAEAAATFSEAIDQLPDGYYRDRGVYLARAAVAHAGAAAPEQAATFGLHALGVAETTSSGRILTQLAKLDGVLQPWADTPEVTQFRTALDDVVLHQAVGR